jgi:2-polyprenyl-3-methyl-5-hydroxy-6-metoxy-1,4-benzoquinol methylase
MGVSLSARQREREWMDDPQADPATLASSLRFIRRINWWLGYTRATLFHLKRFSAGWKPGQTIRILDLATGSADVPRAILQWSRQAGFDVRIVGVDRHAATAAMAAAQEDDRLTIVQGDALDLPFADGAFDYALTSMFLHHLDEPEIIGVLKTMNRLSRRGVIVADLLRHRRAYFWIKVMTVLANPMVRHDAVVSVAQAFTKPEVLSLRESAGLNFTSYHRHFGHRFVLAGEK